MKFCILNWLWHFYWLVSWFGVNAVSPCILWPSVQLGSTLRVGRLISVCTFGLSRMAVWLEHTAAVEVFLRFAGTVMETKWLLVFQTTLFVSWIFGCRSLVGSRSKISQLMQEFAPECHWWHERQLGKQQLRIADIYMHNLNYWSVA